MSDTIFDNESRDKLTALISESVKQTLIQLGITPESPAEMQKDMQFLREFRRTREKLKEKSLLMIVSFVLSGIFVILLLGFKEYFNKH
jgi:hypothetical protein